MTSERPRRCWICTKFFFVDDEVVPWLTGAAHSLCAFLKTTTPEERRDFEQLARRQRRWNRAHAIVLGAVGVLASILAYALMGYREWLILTQ